MGWWRLGEGHPQHDGVTQTQFSRRILGGLCNKKPIEYPTTYKPYVDTGKHWLERDALKHYSQKYRKLKKIFK